MCDQIPRSKPAPCGLYCSVCSHLAEGCPGCVDGGGDPKCYQRSCCRERDLEGCWRCEDFSCGQGFFADDAWRGLCVGFVLAIRELGVERCLERVRSTMGDHVDYGAFRFRTAETVFGMLIGRDTRV